jgi:HPt (histidine-containing phosphotransfer) domain-containing protein
MAHTVVIADASGALQALAGQAWRDCGAGLLSCTAVDEVLQALAREQVVLVITDPGFGGAPDLGVIRQFAAIAGPQKLAVACTPVEAPGVRQLGVQHLLGSPPTAAALARCVHGAMAVELNFAGDTQFYSDFRADCLRQFAADVARGDRHAAACELQAFRNLAHDLKSVLRVLGENDASACAQRMEGHLAARAWPPALLDWARLRASLLVLTVPCRS